MNAKQCETCFYMTYKDLGDGYCWIFRKEPEGDFCAQYQVDDGTIIERANSAFKKGSEQS